MQIFRLLTVINDGLKSFWLKRPSIGLRRVILHLFLVTVFVLVAIYIKSTILILTGVFVLIAYLSYLLHGLIFYGFCRRLAVFKSQGVNLEIVDDIKIANKDNSLRYIRTVGTEFKYGKVLTSISRNRSVNIYLPIVNRVFVDFFNKEPVKILFLGGGAQLLPLSIAATRNDIIHVVEISQKLIEISRKYFYPIFEIDGDHSITTFNEDAYTFVKRTKEKYDFIFQDICVGTNVPHRFLTGKWFSRIERLLTRDGLFSISVGPIVAKDAFKKFYAVYSWAISNRYYASVFQYQGVLIFFITRSVNKKKLKNATKIFKKCALDNP